MSSLKNTPKILHNESPTVLIDPADPMFQTLERDPELKRKMSEALIEKFKAQRKAEQDKV